MLFTTSGSTWGVTFRSRRFFFASQNRQRAFRKRRRGDGFDEKLRQFDGGLFIHFAIQSDYAAEGRYGIACQRLPDKPPRAPTHSLRTRPDSYAS